MKVIFIKDAPKIGKKDEVKDINDGYVRNFLLPQKIVEIATPEAMAKLNKKLGDRKAGMDAEDIRNKLLIDSLAGQSLTIVAKSNDKNALFKSVTVKDIISTIKKDLKISAPDNIFDQDVHIKLIGEYDLAIKLGNHKSNIKINIVKE